MIINFKKFRRYTDLSRKAYTEVDAREVFADRIYNVTGRGIADLKLAEKIYMSESNTDYTEEEVERIKRHAELGLPWFIDSLNFYLNL